MNQVNKHYTATVFIISDSKPVKVLLAHHRKFNHWMPAGGHQEAWENPIEAAIRETLEETGIDISHLLPPSSSFDATAKHVGMPKYFLEEEIQPLGDQPFHYHLDQIYIVTVPEQAAQHDEKEAHDIGWFTLEEAEKLPTFENVRLILRQEMQP